MPDRFPLLDDRLELALYHRLHMGRPAPAEGPGGGAHEGRRLRRGEILAAHRQLATLACALEPAASEVEEVIRYVRRLERQWGRTPALSAQGAGPSARRAAAG